jgi:hypothetical protein
MNKQNRKPIDLMPFAYVAFWVGLFTWLSILAFLHLS